MKKHLFSKASLASHLPAILAIIVIIILLAIAFFKMIHPAVRQWAPGYRTASLKQMSILLIKNLIC